MSQRLSRGRRSQCRTSAVSDRRWAAERMANVPRDPMTPPPGRDRKVRWASYTYVYVCMYVCHVVCRYVHIFFWLTAHGSGHALRQFSKRILVFACDSSTCVVCANCVAHGVASHMLASLNELRR